jgi:SAM-dependent methyltransferase
LASSCSHRSSCRLCGGQSLTRVLSLEPTPPANAFVSAADLDRVQERYPLDVYFCDRCAHVQLLDSVDPQLLFENYVYVSGTSPVFVKHFEAYAEFVRRRYPAPPHGFAVDIGSNDGTLLSFFRKAGLRTLGIDPAREIAARATSAGIETIAGFFTPELARRIREERGPADVITANNVFAHIDDLAGAADGVRSLLAPNGVFVFEVSYLVDVFEKTLFDTIYHEHLSYHSVKPLRRFLDSHGLQMIEAVRIDSHGGSIRVVAQHWGGPHGEQSSVAEAVALEERLGLDTAAAFHDLARRIGTLKTDAQKLLRRLKAEGRSVAGFGAPAKTTTLMYHFGIGPDIVDFIVDDSPLKQNLFTPGMHVPVLAPQAIYDRRPDYVIVLAWNFADSIMARHKAYSDAGGRFIILVPSIRIV